MAEVGVTSALPASVDKTWAMVSDVSRFGEWLTIHDGWRGAVPEEITAGLELTSVVRVKALRNRIAWRVVSHNPPRSLSITGRGVGGLQVELVLVVRPAGEKAQVSVHAKITGPPTIGPLGLVIGRALRGELRRSVDALTDLLR
jgi:hypothetical protein